MFSDRFTVHGLFRTSRVLERADYITVRLERIGRYQVIKGQIPRLPGEVLLLDETEHQHYLGLAKRPIVLDDDYMALDGEGYVEW